MALYDEYDDIRDHHASEVSNDDEPSDIGAPNQRKALYLHDIPMTIHNNHIKYQNVTLRYKNVDLCEPFKVTLTTKIGKFQFAKMSDTMIAVIVDGNPLEPEYGKKGYSIVVETPFNQLINALY